MAERRQHPSGKPVRVQRVVARGWTNTPPAEPLTPGLRKQFGAYAVGFTAQIVAEDED